MKPAELLAFADLLSRHLAGVIAAERGYVEKPCPSCSRVPARDDGFVEGFAADGGVLRERIDIAVRVASGACPKCHGGRRVWFRPKARFRSLSDRELINRAARESAQSGRLPGGDRPEG